MNTLFKLLEPEYMGRELLIVHQFIRMELKRARVESLEELEHKPSGKRLAYIDIEPQKMMERSLQQFKDVVVMGEETGDLASIDVKKDSRFSRGDIKYVVLLDMVDGTDLLKRGFSNWCSAVVILDVQKRRIEGSYILLENDLLYFSNRDEAQKIPLKRAALDSDSQERVIGSSQVLRLPKTGNSLKDASVCMYGQKISAFRRLISLSQERARFAEWVEKPA